MADSSRDEKRTQNRLLSLDALRGTSILIMLLVNHFGPISIRPLQLRHAGWNENLHIADMAFPWFLFCVGISIPFSAVGFKKQNLPQWKYDVKVLRRFLSLLALGAILSISKDHKFVLFSMGVLQIIALAYIPAVMLYDLPIYTRLAITAVALVSYWAAIEYIPVPGIGPGVFNEHQNLIQYVNRQYFGNVGLSGITVVIPTSALVMIGTVIGDLMQCQTTDQYLKMKKLLFWGVGLTAGGFLWTLSLQFNKPVWTPSYILFSAGTGTLLLGLFYLVADVRENPKYIFPLIVFGSNAILAYVLPALMKNLILRPLGFYTAGWAFVIPFTLFWWIVLWVLFRRRLFFRV